MTIFFKTFYNLRGIKKPSVCVCFCLTGASRWWGGHSRSAHWLCWGSSRGSRWDHSRKSRLGSWDGLEDDGMRGQNSSHGEVAAGWNSENKHTHLHAHRNTCDGAESPQPCTEAGRRGAAGSCGTREARSTAWTSVWGETLKIRCQKMSQKLRASSASEGCRINVIENLRHGLQHRCSCFSPHFCCHRKIRKWRPSRIRKIRNKRSLSRLCKLLAS